LVHLVVLADDPVEIEQVRGDRVHLVVVERLRLDVGHRAAHVVEDGSRSPFWNSARIASSIALAIGTLQLMTAESAPSARIHCALRSTPASSSSKRNGTPLHSLHDTSPCV
jgi:hypothetical protein